jgi:plasmid stabilization system protein ParE
MAEKYRLRYLPLFEDDLAEARDYIVDNLHNPQAALRLIEETERAILKRAESPQSFAPFPSRRARPHPYYVIHVRNFSVFYVLLDGIMEVRRFIYSRRDLERLL